MFFRRTALFGLVVAAALLMRPVAAPAVAVTAAPTPPASQRVTFTYKTFLAPQRTGSGPYGNLNEDFGTISLTFTADGIISGTYKPEFGNFTPVTGGRTAPNQFWLEFGSGRLRFSGHFTRHGIVATAASFSAREWQLHGSFVSAS